MAEQEEKKPIRVPRRDRIKNKGSDRLAFITGQIRELPPVAAPGEPDSERRHSHTASCPPDLSRDHPPPDRPSLGSISQDQSLENHEYGFEPGQSNKYEGEIRTGLTSSVMRKCESNREPSRALDPQTKEPPFQASSAVNSGISTSQGGRRTNQTSYYPDVLTPHKIISAIKACETARIRCSLAVAIIVVLCYLGFPILGSSPLKNIILFRPLLLLLLTNITIVVRHLLLDDSGSKKVQNEASNAVAADETDLADQVGKALELGLMLQKVIGALFIDSSIYSILVICSLSFAQKLGW